MDKVYLSIKLRSKFALITDKLIIYSFACAEGFTGAIK